MSLIITYLALGRALVNVVVVPSQNITTCFYDNSILTYTPIDLRPFDLLNWFFAMFIWLHWIRSFILNYESINYHIPKEALSNKTNDVDFEFLDVTSFTNTIILDQELPYSKKRKSVCFNISQKEVKVGNS